MGNEAHWGMGHMGNRAAGGMGYKGYGSHVQWGTGVWARWAIGHMDNGAHRQFAPKMSKRCQVVKKIYVKLSNRCQMSKIQTPGLWRRFIKK